MAKVLGGGGNSDDEAPSEGLPNSFIFLFGSLGLMMFRCFSCLSFWFDDVSLFLSLGLLEIES